MFVKNYSKYGPPWLPGRVIKCTGPVSSRVEVEGGFQVRRHFDQIRKRQPEEQGEVGPADIMLPSDLPRVPLQQAEQASSPRAPPADTAAKSSTASPSSETAQLEEPEQPSTIPARRYPLRDRRPPERLQL